MVWRQARVTGRETQGARGLLDLRAMRIHRWASAVLLLAACARPGPPSTPVADRGDAGPARPATGPAPAPDRAATSSADAAAGAATGNAARAATDNAARGATHSAAGGAAPC